MKRTKPHVLENESRKALENLLPPEWIFRKKIPDYAIDAEIQIVENEKVTEKVVWVQLKATEEKKDGKGVSLQIGTRYLKYYEKCNLPVLILYWIKSEDIFYYIFAQEYICEVLSRENPQWREQETAMLGFESKLEDAKNLESVATVGYFYVLRQKLNVGPETSAYYWLDGIPQSDNTELKERTLRALLHILKEEHRAAIDELEETLRVCTLSPTERMSILLSLGNTYYSLSRIEDALGNYEAVLKLSKKVDEESALEGRSAALGNIGVIYSDKGNLDEALKYFTKALEIHREIGHKQGEANALGNIGITLKICGKSTDALKHLNESVEIFEKIGMKRETDIISSHILEICLDDK